MTDDPASARPAQAPSPDGGRGAATGGSPDGRGGDPVADTGRALRTAPIDDPDTHRSEWTVLAERSGNIFATWAWHACWRAHHPAGDRVLVACRDDAGRLVAILPLVVRSHGPLRVLRFAGYGAADELGPICDPADRPAVAEALASLLEAPPRAWDVFLGERLPGDLPWAAILAGRELRREASPVLRFEVDTWDELLERFGSGTRRDLARKERTLAREHRVALRMAADPERLADDLSTLFSLHAERWAAGESSFVPRQTFHRAFAAEALANDWLRLAFLEVDDRPVAAAYDLRFGTAHSHYNSGRDPAWARASVGMILRMRTIRAALEDGALEYRYLRGGEAYKYRLATDDPGVVTVARSRGARGAAALRAVLAAADRRRLRTMLRRLG